MTLLCICFRYYLCSIRFLSSPKINIIMYFSHSFPLTSHIRGICYQPKWHFSVQVPTLHLLAHKRTFMDWRLSKTLYMGMLWNTLTIHPDFHFYLFICQLLYMTLSISNPRTYATFSYSISRIVREYCHCISHTDLYAGFPYSNSCVIRRWPVSILAYAFIWH